jgi:hypothetical protein
MSRNLIVCALALVLAAGSAQAGSVTFDLEDLGPGPIAGAGTVTTWSQVDIDGTLYDIGLQIGYFQSGGAPNTELSVTDLSGFLAGDPVWGSRSLSFFSAPGTAYGDKDYLTLEPDLSLIPPSVLDLWGVGQIGWDMGDLLGTDEEFWTLETYGFPSSDPAYQPKVSENFPQGLTGMTNPGLELRPSANPDFWYSTERQNRAYSIMNARLSAGSNEFPNSVYFDNFTLTFQELDFFSSADEGRIDQGSDAPETAFGGGSGNNPFPPANAGTGSGQFPAGAAVPLPAGAWLGLTMLAGLGLRRMFRRRRGE